MTKSLDARAATPLVSMSSAPAAPVQLLADNVARIAAPTFVSATTSSATFDVRIPSPAPAGLLPFVDGVAQPHITVTEAAGALQRITVANLPAGTRSVALAPLYDLVLEVKGERSIETPVVVAGAPVFVLIGPSSIVLGNSPTFTLTSGGVDVTTAADFTTSDPTVLAMDPPTLTGAPTPASITQGTGPIAFTWPCTNPRSIQTLGGLPAGVTAGPATVVDGTHISFPLTATGSAAVGAASVYLVDTPHGNSGTQPLTVASAAGYVSPLTTTPPLIVGADFHAMTAAQMAAWWYDHNYDTSLLAPDSGNPFRTAPSMKIPLTDATLQHAGYLTKSTPSFATYQRSFFRVVVKCTGMTNADLALISAPNAKWLTLNNGTAAILTASLAVNSDGSLKLTVIGNGQEYFLSSTGVNHALADGNWHELVFGVLLRNGSTVADVALYHGTDDGSGHFTRSANLATGTPSLDLGAGFTGPQLASIVFDAVPAAGTVRSVEVADFEIISGNTDGSTGTAGTVTPLTAIGS